MRVRAFPLAAPGSDWEPVFERGGLRVFVDRTSVRQSGDLVAAWLRFEYPSEQPASVGWPAYRGSFELRVFDRTAQASGRQHLAVFAAHDFARPLKSLGGTEVELEPVAPGSIGDAVMRAVCRAH